MHLILMPGCLNLILLSHKNLKVETLSLLYVLPAEGGGMEISMNENINNLEQETNRDRQDMDEKTVQVSDSVEALRIKAAQNLERIGFVGIQDILTAFKDRNEKGQFTSVTELRINYWDPAAECITLSRSKAVTMSPEIKIEKAGGYTTLILQFQSKDDHDLNQIWTVLSEYGGDSAEISPALSEVPVLNITSVPMSLGGKFGMVASDPVFWTLQPSVPFETNCNQVRILFQPESVLFLRDDSFESDEIIAKVKSELAAQKLAEEALIRKKMEDEDFKKRHEAELSDYIENGRFTKHTFDTSK